MSENKENVPKIRFPGFSGAWEQRRLGEMAEVYDGTHQTPDYVDEGIMFLSVENIKTLQSDKYISEEAFENEFKVRPEKGDILMTRIGDIGTANVVALDEPIAYYVSLALLKKKDLNPYFLQASIHSPVMQKEIWKRTLHIAFPKKINKNEIAKVLINFPNKQEQDKIGSFFTSLDTLITLHQRKLNNVKKLKAGLLQKMFPKNGEKFPEIRFPESIYAWEQRKLGEISDIRTGPFGSTLHAENYIEDGTPIITTEHFKSGNLPEQKYGIPQVSDDDLHRLKNYILKTDDIVFSRVGSVDINALITPFQNGWLFSGRALRVRSNKNIDSQYLHFELSTERAKNDVIARAVGQTMPSINTEILKQTKVFVPTEIKEQQNIGQLLSALDHLITLHQRKP